MQALRHDGAPHLRSWTRSPTPATRRAPRAEKLPEGDALRAAARALAEVIEKQRAALVATNQGEGISGEEKLREELGTLYGNVNGYEGRPTRSQLDRMAVFEKQLAEAEAKLDGHGGQGVPRPEGGPSRPRSWIRCSRLSKEDWQKRQK